MILWTCLLFKIAFICYFSYYSIMWSNYVHVFQVVLLVTLIWAWTGFVAWNWAFCKREKVRERCFDFAFVSFFRICCYWGFVKVKVKVGFQGFSTYYTIVWRTFGSGCILWLYFMNFYVFLFRCSGIQFLDYNLSSLRIWKADWCSYLSHCDILILCRDIF